MPGPPCQGAANIDHIMIAFADHPVEAGVYEVESKGCAPVAKQARRDILKVQRFAQRRIVERVDLADREAIGGAPLMVDEIGSGVGERTCENCAWLLFHAIAAIEYRLAPVFADNATGC